MEDIFQYCLILICMKHYENIYVVAATPLVTLDLEGGGGSQPITFNCIFNKKKFLLPCMKGSSTGSHTVAPHSTTF